MKIKKCCGDVANRRPKIVPGRMGVDADMDGDQNKGVRVMIRIWFRSDSGHVEGPKLSWFDVLTIMTLMSDWFDESVLGWDLRVIDAMSATKYLRSLPNLWTVWPHLDTYLFHQFFNFFLPNPNYTKFIVL